MLDFRARSEPATYLMGDSFHADSAPLLSVSVAGTGAIKQVDIVKNQLLMRIMSRRLVDRFDGYDEITRSVAGITQDIGLKSATLEVQPGTRPSAACSWRFPSSSG